MKKIEFENKVLEHLIAIADLYAEFDPYADDCLAMTVINRHEGGNSNSYGKWNTREVDCNNSYWKKSKENGVNFQAFIDIDDEAYRTAVGESYSKDDISWVKLHRMPDCKEKI